MASVQRDYILRLTEELGAVLVRLLEQFGLGRLAPEEVLQEAQAAQVALLGPVVHIVPHVDAHTAVWLVRDARKVKLWIKFMRLEAAACRSQGKEQQAAALEARAEALEQVAGELKA